MGKFIVNLEFGNYITPDSIGEGDLFTIYSFSSKHRNFIHPTELGLELKRGPNGIPKIKSSKLKKSFKKGLAYFLGYSEHGNCEWYLSTGEYPKSHCFDSCNLAGVIILNEEYNKFSKEEKEKIASEFLKDYTDWCNGEVYVFSIADSGKIEKEVEISYFKDMLSRNGISEEEKSALSLLILSAKKDLELYEKETKIKSNNFQLYCQHNSEEMFKDIYSNFSEKDEIIFKGNAAFLKDHYPFPAKRI